MVVPMIVAVTERKQKMSQKTTSHVSRVSKTFTPTSNLRPFHDVFKRPLRLSRQSKKRSIDDRRSLPCLGRGASPVIPLLLALLPY